MYPSTRFSLIKKAIDYFSHGFSEFEQQQIDAALSMVKFGMSSVYMSFRDRYYFYTGAGEKEDVALAIGGHESAFFADLVVSYLFEVTRECFSNATYRGIYRDDGFVVFRGHLTPWDLRKWLAGFQSKVNSIIGDDFFQFTADLWIPSGGFSEKREDGVKVVNSKMLPYLDMNIYWDE